MTAVKLLFVVMAFGLWTLVQGQSVAKTDPAKTDPAKTDPAKTDPAKTDPAKTDVPKTDAAKVEWQNKSFAVKFVDPDDIRQLFASRSFVMEVNQGLKVITVTGPPAFLKEVEDTIRQFDLPPPPPANIQVSVYLLTTAAQAPSGIAVPAEIGAMTKEFGSQKPKLADLQVLRVREGDAGQVVGQAGKPDSASLSRASVQSAAIIPGKKGEMVSLHGLRVWLSIPATPPGTTAPPLTADPDVIADVDIDTSQPVMVSKVGVGQPVMLVVRATIIR